MVVTRPGPVEVCFLVGPDDTVLWADRSTSPAALPDSHARWAAVWARRDRLVEIAHSHPVGPLAFYLEDETTMAALEAALGPSLTFSVVTPTGMLRIAGGGPATVEHNEPWWAALLRAASGL